MENTLLGFVGAISDARAQVTVVGDVILDIFSNTAHERMSSEAQVPIVKLLHDDRAPGGAGNVASNIAALGGHPQLISVMGSGFGGTRLRELLEKNHVNTDGIIIDQCRRTTTKTRILVDGQQVLCLARETRDPIKPWVIERILECLRASKDTVVIISDYNRGMISENLIERIIREGKERNQQVICDVHPRDGFKLLSQRGAFLITPNRIEAARMADLTTLADDDRSAETVSRTLAHLYESNVLLTRDHQGMTLCTSEGLIEHIPAKEANPLSVSGAGDTVVGTIALALASGIDLSQAAKLASYAAAVVVGKPGTSSVSSAELADMITNRTQTA